MFDKYISEWRTTLVFTKGGTSDAVLFCDVQADGFSLDDKRQAIADSDLPKVLAKYRDWCTLACEFEDRTSKVFQVSVSEIRANKYDLSINRYKVPIRPDVTFDPPQAILERMRILEAAIESELTELEKML